jgi:hypothetical protein
LDQIPLRAVIIIWSYRSSAVGIDIMPNELTEAAESIAFLLKEKLGDTAMTVVKGRLAGDLDSETRKTLEMVYLHLTSTIDAASDGDSGR